MCVIWILHCFAFLEAYRSSEPKDHFPSRNPLKDTNKRVGELSTHCPEPRRCHQTVRSIPYIFYKYIHPCTPYTAVSWTACISPRRPTQDHTCTCRSGHRM